MEASFWDGKRPAGVPDEIDPEHHESVLDLFQSSCRKFSDRPAFSNMGVTLTYAELERLANDFAGYLQSRPELQPGDRFAIVMPNLLQFPIAVFGALKAGLVVVNVNPFYTPREMKHQLKDSGAKGILFINMLGDLVESVLPHTDLQVLIRSTLGDMHTTSKRFLINAVAKYLKRKIPDHELTEAIPFLDALEIGYQKSHQDHHCQSSDVAMLQYTMGTTGISKGAILTHGNLVANMLQVRGVLSELDDSGQPVCMEGKEVVIAPLPLYHIYAFTAHCLCMVFLGNHNVLVTDPRDTEQFIRTLKQWRFSAFVGLNTLFLSLMRSKAFRQIDFSDLKVTLSGGTALNPKTSERWQKVTQSPIAEAYGLTEASPAVAINPFTHAVPGSAGFPVPNTSIMIADELGNELPLGEVGELCVQGPQVFQGYWNAPDLTAMTLKEGWLHTGDLAYIDNHSSIRIVDRKKDLIIVSGFNVYPNEIENVAMEHNKVGACAAIGVPDLRSGEIVKLIAVKSHPSLTEEELEAWLRANLAGYKVPKLIEFRDQLPMTPVGKIMRRQLRHESEQKLDD